MSLYQRTILSCRISVKIVSVYSSENILCTKKGASKNRPNFVKS